MGERHVLQDRKSHGFSLMTALSVCAARRLEKRCCCG
jgi:hypothetical protein